MSQIYQVNEIFTSIQGEGVFAGVPSTFIRLQGCTVGCVWCDTKYTWAKGGTRMTVDEITERVDRSHVVITGGEPTLYNLDPLLEALNWTTDITTQLETSGQQWLKGKVRPSWITWSPKQTLNYTAPQQFYKYAYEVKFVVDEALTIETVRQIYDLCKRNRALTPHIVLMPEGCPPRPEMIEKALEWLSIEPQWRYGDRLQWRLGVR